MPNRLGDIKQRWYDGTPIDRWDIAWMICRIEDFEAGSESDFAETVTRVEHLANSGNECSHQRQQTAR